MAVFTSYNGYFEITAISFAPNVIVYGEETDFSVTIKNVSGKRITKMYVDMRLYYPDAVGRVSSTPEVYLYGSFPSQMSSVSWANNAERTFTGKFKFETYGGSSFVPNITTRLAPLYAISTDDIGTDRGMLISIVTDATFGNGANYDNFYNVRGRNSEYLAVIDAWYKPAVTAFTASRCTNGLPDDEGENSLTSLKLYLPNNADKSGFTLKFYSAADADVNENSVPTVLTSYIPAALAGITDSSVLITQSFSVGNDWDFMVVFEDAYERAVGYTDLPRAFANLHLSGCDTGGACFGGFSSSTENNPKLESKYPVYPYLGIKRCENAAYEVQLELNSQFNLYSEDPGLRLMVYGNVVHLSGIITPAAAIAGSTTEHVITTIPDEFAPKYPVTQIQQASTTAIWMLRVYPLTDHDVNMRGKAVFSRHRNGGSYASCAAGNWLPLDATWIV